MYGHLTRPAKQIKNANGGRKMEVWAILSGPNDTATSGWFNNEWPMPNLEKKATRGGSEMGYSWACRDFYRDTIMGSLW